MPPLSIAGDTYDAFVSEARFTTATGFPKPRRSCGPRRRWSRAILCGSSASARWATRAASSHVVSRTCSGDCVGSRRQSPTFEALFVCTTTTTSLARSLGVIGRVPAVGSWPYSAADSATTEIGLRSMRGPRSWRSKCTIRSTPRRIGNERLGFDPLRAHGHTVTLRTRRGDRCRHVPRIVFWLLSSASSSRWRSSVRPFVSAASKAFIVGP